MSVIQVGLVDTTGQLDPKLVQATAAALNVQVIRDLPQYWSVTATVRYLPDPKQIPVGVWPVFLVAELPPGEGGVHLDKKNQPYALVIGTPASTDWTLDASHETVEMLVDPAGNRLQVSRAIEIAGNDVRDAIGQFEYLVEACDPCEGSQYAYTIQGVAVSDFITPRFYDPVATGSARYSYAGHIQRPRQILPGGYISFTDPASNSLQQIQFLGPKPILKDLGAANGKPLRVLSDGGSYTDVRNYRTHKQNGSDYRRASATLAKYCTAHRQIVDAAAVKRGAAYRSLNSKR
jgi:hypothetical protein